MNEVSFRAWKNPAVLKKKAFKMTNFSDKIILLFAVLSPSLSHDVVDEQYDSYLVKNNMSIDQTNGPSQFWH